MNDWDDLDEFERNKRFVEMSCRFEQKNNNRFHTFRNFAFKNTLLPAEVAVLKSLNRPIMEFNIIKQLISKLVVNFGDSLPSVLAKNSSVYPQPQPAETLKVVSGYCRHSLCNAENKNSFRWDLFFDGVSGGFSWAEVLTKYPTPYSFEKIIEPSRVFDPTLCGGDPLAILADKSDGRFTFKGIPLSKRDFKERFGMDPNTTGMTWTGTANAGMNWSYYCNEEPLIMLCEFYEKFKRNLNLVKLSDETIIGENHLEEYYNLWKQSNPFQQLPVIVDKKKAKVDYIKRRLFIQSEELEVEEMIGYHKFPLIYVPGYMVQLRPQIEGSMENHTMPYCYDMVDIQRLKNMAGQTLANELQNMTQTKVMMAIEAQAAQYKDNLTDIQKGNTWFYRAFKEGNPDVPLPTPVLVQRQNIPQEVYATFNSAEQTLQSISGSYEVATNQNKNNVVSGTAIFNSELNSNAAARPYVHGCMAGLTSVMQLMVSLMPYFMNSKRSIPVMDARGEVQTREINGKQQQRGPDGKPLPVVSFIFPPDSIHISVEAGPSFKLQQQQAMEQIQAFSKTVPNFGEIIGDPSNIGVIFDNIDFNGVETVKENIPKIMEQKMQMQAQAAQQQNPEMMKLQIDATKLQIEKTKLQQQMQLETQKLQQSQNEMMIESQQRQEDAAIAREEAITERMRVVLDAKEQQDDNHVQLVKAKTEREIHGDEHDLKLRDIAHRHAKDVADHHLKKSEIDQRSMFKNLRS